jgi:hypothetical protein
MTSIDLPATRSHRGDQSTADSNEDQDVILMTHLPRVRTEMLVNT